MYSTEHRSDFTEGVVSEDRDTVLERTEELPDALEGRQIKKRFQERGGNAYIKEAASVESDEFILLNGTGDKALVMKNVEGIQGFYEVDETGNSTLILGVDDLKKLKDLI